MKKWILFFTAAFYCITAIAQIRPFRFVHLSDIHIGSPNGVAEEDLQRTISDINQMTDVAFVVITGDITEMGTDKQLASARQLLGGLRIPYHIIPGNHDACWSESGGVSFIKTFGADKFQFDYNGVRLFGCPSGPYERMSDGHVPKDAIVWMDKLLKTTSPHQPLIFFNHYPMDSTMDNWFEVTERLKQYNILMIACGHGHSNKTFDFEDIPGVMGRSNLRARDSVGGYNLVDVTPDSIIYSERKPGLVTGAPWAHVAVKRAALNAGKKFYRPDYSVNSIHKNVTEKWTYADRANVISTPAVNNGQVIFGNQVGTVTALSLATGRKQWVYQTGGAIYSSPATSGDHVLFGSGDGYIYCLSSRTGKLRWRVKTGASVLGSPLVDSGLVYIGGSDHTFRALQISDGRQRWIFDGLEGPVVSKPLLYEDALFFGAWDNHLYALDKSTGKLRWKWENGSPVINLSPAACIPVAHDGVVYIVAPDRCMSAIDASNGKTLWRSKQFSVRESIGISADGRSIYGKTMSDSIVAFTANRQQPQVAWAMNAGFGYEHVPSMLIEKGGNVFFGTRTGLVYAINPQTQKVVWVHKADHAMINTVNVIDPHQLIVASMNGKVMMLRIE